MDQTALRAIERRVVDKTGSGKAVPLYGQEGFAGMRAAGRLAAMTLDHVAGLVRVGVSTAELDREIERFMGDHGGIPATKGYRGYTASSCISVNHVVNHGIPDPRERLRDGDILNIDVTVILDGWHGDSSRMYVAGERVPVKGRLLIARTYEAMWVGIDAVRPGLTLDDLGWTIQKVAEEPRHGVRFSVVREFVGHGVGREFHQPPEIRHFRDPDIERRRNSMALVPGMIFTIEPMINAGRPEVKILKDGWTTVTKDRSLSAQFEHTVGVTEAGCEVFTRSPAGHEQPPYPAS